ncbi:leucine-rich repeat domain-containing protein [Sporanaerobacter sp. PP17-6a]|uniref:leucine-rich repeat domain-containing protein n=1 Tax=Sporanaerobacter sp. PP17-6a TaxID=1891289 RepID=UPI0008A04734|nr:leucine-rich repeat domain-containing protein [Sporanaerobacter sp. PP17-6a]SCL85894.1 hypothetical protein PP176A_0959 [Sporanaerobacter sp. PP17-6a]
MIRRKRQLLSIVLVGIMMLASFPFFVFAEDVGLDIQQNVETGAEAPEKEETEGEIPEEPESEPETFAAASEEEVPTPEELGYEFDAGKREITKYTGTETEIVIPSEFKVNGEVIPVESIGTDAFSSCTTLNKVTLNEGLKTIGVGAFQGTAIEEIDIPGSVEIIDEKAFYSCVNLKEATLNEGLKTIGNGTFQGTAIKEIDIPGSVESIREKAFYSCINLKEVILNEGLKTISRLAFGSTAVEEIDIPGSIGSIDTSAFYSCTSLKEVTLHEGLKTIGYGAFQGVAIEEIDIPSTIEKIGSKIFDKAKIQKITVLNKKENIDIAEDAFPAEIEVVYKEDEVEPGKP